MSTEKIYRWRKLWSWQPGRFLPELRCGCLFLCLAVFLLLAVPGEVAANDRQPMKKVGVIVYGSPFLKSFDGFHAGLQAAGYREGVDVELSIHNINGNQQSVPVLVQEFIQHHYDLILAVTTPVAVAVKKAAEGREIPVLFTTVADPVGSNVVTSLRKPGNNISGVSHIAIPLMMKRLTLFHEAFPALKRVAVFYNPGEKFLEASLSRFFNLAFSDAGIKIVEVKVRNVAEMKAACERLSGKNVDGIFMVPDPLPMARFADLLACSRREKLPLMVVDNMLLAKGGVMGYSPDVYDVGFQAAGMAVNIFHGVKVGDLPVQNPDKIKLVVSLKEAKVLGLPISRDILRRADEVIR